MSHVTVSGVWEGREKVSHVGVSGAGKRCHHGGGNMGVVGVIYV